MTCVRFLIEGRVQGVFYRSSTRDKARELNLTGWVWNRHDGDVEVLACGLESSINMLERWLWQGPAHAQVVNVKRMPADDQFPETFSIRY